MAFHTMKSIENVSDLTYSLDNKPESVLSILDHLLANACKNGKHSQTVVSYINTLLADASTRSKGLFILQTVLPQLPDDILTENATAWINNSLKAYSNQNDLTSAAYDLIGTLLEICGFVPEINKSITGGILSKLVEKICHSSDHLSAVKCLQKCLKLFPGPCGLLRHNVEKFLLAFIDKEDETLVREAAYCLHLLSQTSGTSSAHSQAWGLLQQRLITTIHSLFDELFGDVIEVGNVERPKVELLSLPGLRTATTKLLSVRMINLIVYLEEMLLGDFPSPKPVMLDLIMDLITRGLAIKKNSLGINTSFSTLTLAGYLCIIHKNLLELLQSLMLCLGGNILTEVTLISKLIIEVLKSTPAKDAFNVDSYRNLRIAAYQTLIVLVNMVKSQSRIEVFSKELVDMVVSDITPYKNQVTLNITKGNTKHMSKKERNAAQQQMIANSNIGKKFSSGRKPSNVTNPFHAEICSWALETVTVLLNAGVVLSPKPLTLLQDTVLDTLYDVQRGDPSTLSGDVNCQIKFYKAVIALALNPHPIVAPPLNHAVALVSKGEHSNDVKISETCSSGLAGLEKLVHPTSATLYIPQEKIVERDGEVADAGISEASDVNEEVSSNRDLNFDNESQSVMEVVSIGEFDGSVTSELDVVDKYVVDYEECAEVYETLPEEQANDEVENEIVNEPNVSYREDKDEVMKDPNEDKEVEDEVMKEPDEEMKEVDDEVMKEPNEGIKDTNDEVTGKRENVIPLGWTETLEEEVNINEILKSFVDIIN